MATPLPNQAVPPIKFTPRDDPKQRPMGEPAELPTGIGDSRKLPGQEIFEPTTPDIPEMPPIPDIASPEQPSEATAA